MNIQTPTALELADDIKEFTASGAFKGRWQEFVNLVDRLASMKSPPGFGGEAMERALVDEARLRSTDRADVWAEEFAKVVPYVDRGLMIGWFANCAENAKDLQDLRHDPPTK